MARRMREAPEAPPADEAAVQGCFRVTFPYGFIDEDGVHRFWQAGQAVVDADELDLLQSRGVSLQEG